MDGCVVVPSGTVPRPMIIGRSRKVTDAGVGRAHRGDGVHRVHRGAEAPLVGLVLAVHGDP